MQRGDVVIALNSAPTDRMTHVNFVASLSCGLKVVLLIARDSGDDELNATDTTDTDRTHRGCTALASEDHSQGTDGTLYLSSSTTR